MTLSDADISRIVEMAWEDRTPFEAIEVQFGLNESGVVTLMRSHMKASSFRMWRKRMAGRRRTRLSHGQAPVNCAQKAGNGGAIGQQGMGGLRTVGWRRHPGSRCQNDERQ